MKIKNKKQFKSWLLAGIFACALPLLSNGQIIGTAKAAIPNGEEQNITHTGVGCTGTTMMQSQSAVATDASQNYIIVWQDLGCDGDGNGIYFQKYDKLGNPVGSHIRANTTTVGNQKDPAISMDQNGNFVITWDGNGSGDADGIFAQAFNSSESPIGTEFAVNTSTTGVQNFPKVALNYSESSTAASFSIVWSGPGTGDTDGGIYMQRYTLDFTGSANPTAVGTNILVNTTSTGVQQQPDIAMNNFGETIVVWSGPGTGFPSTNEVWLQAYGSDGTAWGTEQRVNNNTAGLRPSIAADKSSEPSSNLVPGGKFIISYDGGSSNGIFAKTLNRCTSAGCVLNAVELSVNTNTNGTKEISKVSADYLGNFTVGWEDDSGQDSDGLGIYAQSYNYLGHRIGIEFKANTTIAGDQADPSITMDKYGNYIIAWSSGTISTYNVFFQRFVTDIFKSGSQTLANTPNANYSEFESSTAIAPNGYKVVAYVDQDTSTDPIQTGIFYSLFDNNNNPVVGAQGVRADTTSDSSPANPSVSFFKDISGDDVGSFVIAWEENDPSGSPGTNVVYREFNNAGVAQTGAENLISTTTFSTETNTNIHISAGYYLDPSSTVIDRFAVDWTYMNTSPCQKIVQGAYHTPSGFSISALETTNDVCTSSYDSLSGNMNGDINGNDEIVYTWRDATQINAMEANGNSTLPGSLVQVNTSGSNLVFEPDVAFISPTEYVITWSECNDGGDIDGNCDTGTKILASRYTGNFSGGTPTITSSSNSISNSNFVVYGGDSNEQTYPHIAADATNGSFLIVWQKHDITLDFYEIYGKFFMISPNTANFGVGFPINSTQTGNEIAPSAGMNSNGKAVIGWEGDFGTDNYGVGYQVLVNPMYTDSNPELPALAQLQIAPGGKTLVIPSDIQFPSITASTTADTTVEREVFQNPVAGQPLFFQLEDLGGNSSNCSPGPCYSVNISSTDFSYTDPSSGQTYTIPSSDIYIKNYDGDNANHTGVVDTGTCGSAPSLNSFESLFGNAADFSLDPSTCDYAPLNTPETLLNKVSNTNDTAKIQWYPKLKIVVPKLTPPGTYTGTMTITSA